MPDAELSPPFDAYKGDEPYIFVSYAHKDGALVYPQITRLHEAGYRIWYDEGIDPGQEWPEAVALALEESNFFLVFVSPQAVASHNVRKEIHFAMEIQKPFVAVHLVKTELPSGLRLVMGSIQAILQWRTSADRYWRKLEQTLPAAARQGRLPEHVHNPWERPGANLGDEITGPDGGKMVWVPPGEFMMGSPEGEAYLDEHPQHKVRITKGFWLGKYTVKNGQYRAFCQATGRVFPEGSGNGPNHPVVCVSWDDAAAYCDHNRLVLPTEAQWEYAARGPQSLRYPWGNEWDPKKCCNFENLGAGHPPTMEVGSIPAGDSWCGLCDMAGNVWEWCADWYQEGYYAESPVDDPSGPESGIARLLRGGSWGDDAFSCRSAIRHTHDPDHGGDDFGFRVARTP